MPSFFESPRSSTAGLVLLAGAAAFGLLVTGGAGCRRHPPGPPGADQLPVLTGLPDPLRFSSGEKVRDQDGWLRRRGEVRDVLLSYEYGHPPSSTGTPSAEVVSSETLPRGLTRRRVRLTLPGGAVSFELGMLLPAGDGPFPAVLHIDHRGPFAAPFAEEVALQGVLYAGLDPTQLAPDRPGEPGPVRAAHPGAGAGALAIWAWGASRAADHLLALPSVNRRQLMVTGHSRSGKAALLCGALDERFALVAPMGSGAGGAALFRHRDPAAESLAQVTAGFPHWFHPRLAPFAGREDRLPFDQHFLMALVAPRALVMLEAAGDLWANPAGTRKAALAARPVFQLLGAAGRIALYTRPGEHEQTAEEWLALLELAGIVLEGREPAQGRDFGL